MIDLSLLQILKNREQFEKVYKFIPKSAIDKRTKAVVEDIKKYFDANQEETTLDFPAFRSLFFTVYHKTLKKEDTDYYNQVITRMEADVPDSVKRNMVNHLLELELATNVGNIIAQYQQGDEIDVGVALGELYDKYKTMVERHDKFEFADFHDSTVGDEDDDTGLLWPLPVMNEIYRRIQGGDQYIIAARPGKGKTSFLTFLLWSMAQQMPANKKIIWFNNESRRQRIMSRQIMSALNMTNSEMAHAKKEGTLSAQYKEAMGSTDRVRVYDVHGRNTAYIEDILETVGLENVGGLVFDMLDNVQSTSNKEVREDQRLESLYQWSRGLAVKYNCASFPTSQISNEGADNLFPAENMLKESKTGKQGACDGIIMLGAKDDPMAQNTRGLSMPKTKSKREGMPDMHEEIIFDADRGRFK